MGRPERVIRRCLNEWVGKRDRPIGRSASLLEEPCGNRPFQRGQRLHQPGEPARLGEPAGRAEHRSGFDKTLRIRRTSVEPRSHERAEIGSRWQGQIRRLPKHLGDDLVEDRRGVQRAAAGMGPDAVGRPRRKVIDAHRGTQLPYRGDVEPANADPGAMAVLDQAVEAGEMASR